MYAGTDRLPRKLPARSISIAFNCDNNILKLVSYNCRGLKLGANCYYERLEVEHLLTDYNIVCLQETWLSKQQEGDLKCMNNVCNAVENSPNDDSHGIYIGRKKDDSITPHKYEYDWVVSIEIAYDNKQMFIFNVYLPCDKQENEEEFIDRLAKLHNLVAECDSSCIAIVGDFNANVRNNANFAALLNEFCQQFRYVWSSRNILPNDTYTYVSDAWGSFSWLDHCISTEDGNRTITGAHVDYGAMQSDHIPVILYLNLQLAPDLELGKSNDVTSGRVDWAVLSDEVINNYSAQTDLDWEM